MIGGGFRAIEQILHCNQNARSRHPGVSAYGHGDTGARRGGASPFGIEDCFGVAVIDPRVVTIVGTAGWRWKFFSKAGTGIRRELKYVAEIDPIVQRIQSRIFDDINCQCAADCATGEERFKIVDRRQIARCHVVVGADSVICDRSRGGRAVAELRGRPEIVQRHNADHDRRQRGRDLRIGGVGEVGDAVDGEIMNSRCGRRCEPAPLCRKNRSPCGWYRRC